MIKLKYVNNWDFCPTPEIQRAYKRLTGNEVSQMYIVVKAISRREAMEICLANDLKVRFGKDYSSETDVNFEIDLCNKSKSGIILSRKLITLPFWYSMLSVWTEFVRTEMIM